MEWLSTKQLAEEGWSSLVQRLPAASLVKVQEAVSQLQVEKRFRPPPAEIVEGLLGASGSSQIAELQPSKELPELYEADALLTRAAGEVARGASLQGRSHALLHQAGAPAPRVAAELSEAECCRWMGIFARRRFTVLLFLGPELAQLSLEKMEGGDSGDEDVLGPEVPLEPGMLVVLRNDWWSVRLRTRGRKRAFSLTCFLQDSRARSNPSTEALRAWALQRVCASAPGSCEGAFQLLQDHHCQKGLYRVAVASVAARLASSWEAEAWQCSQAVGPDVVCEVPLQRWDHSESYDPTEGCWQFGRTACRHAAFIDGVELFDFQLFHLSRKEVQYMEPRQRHALETGYEAMHHAGFRRRKLQGCTAAVYVGAANSSEWPELSGASRSATGFTATGAASSILAGRISFVLGLKGPAVSLDAGDCSSLCAVHFGSQVQREELGAERPEFSCVLGVSVLLSSRSWPPREAAGLLGASGRCRAFDATAAGPVPGEGATAAVLWRNRDEEQEGLLEGMALQHVGRAASLTSTSCPGEQELMCDALRSAAVAPSSVDAVELHGWCRALDDGVGAVAAARALEAGSRSSGKASLCLGTVRSGHAAVEAAQGIAALLRLLAATAYGALAPATHLRQLNPYVATTDCDAVHLGVEPTALRYPAAFAGVTSSGFGTNVHVILWSSQ